MNATSRDFAPISFLPVIAVLHVDLVEGPAGQMALVGHAPATTEVIMLRNPAIIALFLISTAAAIVVTSSTSSCIVTTTQGEGEGEGGGGGEGEGAGGGEGEGAGAGETGAAGCTITGTSNSCCSDGVDNDNNGFTDCDDFACTGDDHCNAGSTTIQSFMDPAGTVKKNFTVTVDHAIVTAVQKAGSGNVTVVIQMPDGEGATGTDPYPTFSGSEVFLKSTEATTFSDVNAGLQIGDCVTVTAVVDLFGKQIQLSKPTAFSKTGGCGSAPTPTVKTIDTINDTGADSKKFLDTLVTVNSVSADLDSSGSNGSFEITDANSNKMFVNGFFLATKPTFHSGDTFTSITGVETQFDVTDPNTHAVTATHFDIDPRIDADMVTP